MASRSDVTAYSAVLATKGLADLEAETIKTVEFLRADGTPAQAQVVAHAYERLLTRLKEIARETAVHAEAYIREEELASRVRPNPTNSGEASLQDDLGQSRPLDAVEGSVGINYEPVLYDTVPWWWTQEEGYSGHIGRVVHGFFYSAGFTGASAPSQAEFREHPLFRAEGPQRDSNSYGPDHDLQSPRKGLKGERPGMRIERPIPARRFVQKGAQRVENEWHAKVRRAKTDFITEVEKAMLASSRIVAARAPGGKRP